MSVEKYKKKLLKERIVIHVAQIVLCVSFFMIWEIFSRVGIINEFLWKCY